MNRRYLIQEENNCVSILDRISSERYFVLEELKEFLLGKESVDDLVIRFSESDMYKDVLEIVEFFNENNMISDNFINKEECEIMLRPHFVSKRSFLTPQLAFIQITELCNMKCKHCFNSCADNRYSELNIDDIKHISKQLKAMDVVNISISGGEPLLHKDFKEIFLHLSKCGFKMNITTNGTAPKTKEYLDLFLEHSNSVRYITFSLGVDVEDYDDIRDEKFFEKVVENLRYYRENGIDSTFCVSMSNKNFHRVENAFKFAKENNINSFAMNILKSTGNASKMDKAFDYTTEELIAFYEKANELEQKYNISVFNDYNTSLRDNIDDYEICDISEDAIVCGASKSNIVIGADKRIYPCSMVEDKLENMGYNSPTIYDISLFESFHKSPQFKFFKEKALNEICEICKPFLPMLNKIRKDDEKKGTFCLECDKCVLKK